MKFATFASLACLVVSAFASANAPAADMNKTLYAYLRGTETGFDPAKYSDTGSVEIFKSIYETLLSYDYLARPQMLVPGSAEAMPEVSEGGRRYTFKVRPGIYFSDDPVFKGKKRELVAQDYVYSLQRLVDQNNRGAPWDFLFKGKIIGLDEKIADAKRTGKFDYDKPIEGFKAVDRYTFQVNLTRPDYLIPQMMGSPATGAVPREAVEAYGDEFDGHPVGTGPYRLREWQRRNHIVLEVNPNFRGITYTPPAGVKVDEHIAAQLAGKTFPRIGVIDIRVIEVPQAAWLAFDSKQLDVMQEMGTAYARMVAPNGALLPKYQDRKLQFYREAQGNTYWHMFNMEDPIVGGYTPEKIGLRRAISYAYDQQWEVNIVKQGQAMPAQTPIGPEVEGYDEHYRNSIYRLDPAYGNAILDKYGYKDCDKDGFREAPGCKPLLITYLDQSNRDTRDYDEMLQKLMSSLGIRLKMDKKTFSDLVKQRQAGQFMMSFGGWNLDYPDAENFMQLLYGPNAGPVNEARFKNKEYDQLYEQIASMPPSAERNAKLIRMSKIVAVQAPWILTNHALFSHIAQPWMIGYRPHPSSKEYWQYYDYDQDMRRSMTGR
ncbi:ABC transporter substrate-binding protein [Chitinimonas sp. PSY-7]|uniref:ABC transporter substrate-binding protein n=1 Tax=Chitinimonas sp. PSY-7 TaxID=3459088 RepID=UPI00404009EA